MNTEQSKRPFIVTWLVVALIYAAVFAAENGYVWNEESRELSLTTALPSAE